MDDPQLTSKDLSLILKRDRVIDSELICEAAWIMWDFLLITKKEVFTWGMWTSSSEEELESESDEEDELSSVDFEGPFEGGFVSMSIECWMVLCFQRVAIWRHCRSSSVIGGEEKGGSGRGCLAPRACEVSGRHPEPISMRMSRWRKRLGQTSSRE